MKLNRAWKIIIGLFTGWMTLSPFLFFAFAFLPIILGMGFRGSNAEPPAEFLFGFFATFIIIILSSFIQIGLTFFYITHIILNSEGDDVIRILIAISNNFLPFVGMPAYYLIYILPSTPPKWAIKEEFRTNSPIQSATESA